MKNSAILMNAKLEVKNKEQPGRRWMEDLNSWSRSRPQCLLPYINQENSIKMYVSEGSWSKISVVNLTNRVRNQTDVVYLNFLHDFLYNYEKWLI